MASSSPVTPYPESPISDRKKLLNPGPAYKRKVFLVLLGIILFWLIYFSLIGVGIWGFIWLLLIPMFYIRYGILLKIGLLAMAAMFLLFLLKFLFKSWKWKDDSMIEIKESEQAQLFAFLRQLSKETGAPFPKKVYVNHEINAKVFYNNPLLSLFLPVRKNLLIGLGLVNSLNLTEFKAVLAHEFGHFSQGSMRLGTYVYMANRIIHDMVYTRDKWDEWFDRWRTSDIRIAVFAWALTPFVFIVRNIMKGLYQALNRLQSSLSRQMEFHADRVAVSAAGSAAIVHALYKLNAAGYAYNFAFQQVRAANDQKLYTNNIFLHHRTAFEHLRHHDKNFQEKLLDHALNQEKESSVYLFKKEDKYVPDMYASHPSGFLRESNAKAIYVVAVEDTNSAWVLFHKSELLEQRVTKILLTNSIKSKTKIRFTPASEVQEFIDDELKETTFAHRYLGYYGNRYLNPIENYALEKLAEQFDITSTSNVNIQLEALYGITFSEPFLKILAAEKEMNEMLNLLPVAKQQGTIKYKGQVYAADALQTTIRRFEEEKGAEHVAWFQQRDQFVFTLYYKALQIMGHSTEDYLDRYHFQWQLQAVYHQMQSIYSHFQQVVQAAQKKGRLDDRDLRSIVSSLSSLSQKATEILSTIKDLKIPSMNNVNIEKDLKDSLAQNPLPSLSSRKTFEKDLTAFDLQMQEILHRCLRLFRKNIGRIVQDMEAIEAAWAAHIKD